MVYFKVGILAGLLLAIFIYLIWKGEHTLHSHANDIDDDIYEFSDDDTFEEE